MQSHTEFIQIGLGFLETYKYDKAVEYFTKAIEYDPLNSEAFELRGISWFRLYNIEQSLSDTTKAIELNKRNHRAWYNKGEVLRYKKQYKEAEVCYSEANTIYSDSLFYLTGLIQTTRAQKKYSEAIAYCDQILKERPADKIALYHRGLAYAKQLNYDIAIKDFLKLIDSGDVTATNYNNIGYWYIKIGNLKKAYNNLSLSLQLNPTHPYALDNMGHLKYLEGDYSKALELITTSLEFDPSNSYGYKNRALVYIKLGQKDSALIDLRKAKLLGYQEDYDNEVDDMLEMEFNL